MEQLRPVELKLVDELFGMSSGYILDFTNSTFAEFFRREVGIDIYDNAYAINGGSKGKHLRAFLTIGQPGAIARALAALWEYRETDRLGRNEAETVANAQTRLNGIEVRLGGSALPSYEPSASATEAKSPVAPRPFRADEAVLHRLEQRFSHSTKCRTNPKPAAAISRRCSPTCSVPGKWMRAVASTSSAIRLTGPFSTATIFIFSRRNGIARRRTPRRFTDPKAR